MIRRLVSVAVASLALGGAVQAQDADEARVMEILKTTPLIDGHNDLPWALRQQYGKDVYAVDLRKNLAASTKLHTDIARLRAGGVGGGDVGGGVGLTKDGGDPRGHGEQGLARLGGEARDRLAHLDP